ncbi:hypothetical protein LCGC14_2240950 [marine sediment metagenome]|uniref:Uncharacterized protein n=1 Tax=marine sediment metagenome TaxID=412755 RepID=A0A0F9D575_9ZZZZ
MADPTDAELDELEVLHNKAIRALEALTYPNQDSNGRAIATTLSAMKPLIKALRACRQHGGAALEVLQDWENTPGNHRGAAWWHEWERKRRAALGKGVGDAN